ncbi:MAG: hypothetical protein AB7U20_07050 [Planctomycetaceae bacterium]
MNTTLAAESEILSRVIGTENPDFTPEVDRSILRLDFDPSDIDRMNELAERARGGTLSEEESSLLDAYLLIGSILDLLQSKARQTLIASSEATNAR